MVHGAPLPMHHAVDEVQLDERRFGQHNRALAPRQWVHGLRSSVGENASTSSVIKPSIPQL